MPKERKDQLEERLSVAKSQRTDAESALNAVAEEALKEARELSVNLAEQREQAQRIMAEAEKTRAEADALHQLVSSEAYVNAQEIVAQAENIKAEADAYGEQVVNEAREKALEIVANAETAITRASDYCAEVIADAQKQAQEIIAGAEKAKAEAEAYAARLKAESDENLLAAEHARAKASAYCDDLIAATQERCKGLIDQSVLAAADEVNRPGVPDNLIPADLIGSAGTSQSGGTTPHQQNSQGAASVVGGHNLHNAAAFTNGSDQADGGQILSVDCSGSLKAFPLKTISSQLLVNDSVAGNAVVVTLEPSLEAGQAFSRVLDGRELTFSRSNINDGRMILMTDQETGSHWETLTGRAVDGPLQGRQLARVNYQHARLLDWQKQHPNTPVYSGAA